jgi:hypothetical protein
MKSGYREELIANTYGSLDPLLEIEARSRWSVNELLGHIEAP